MLSAKDAAQISDGWQKVYEETKASYMLTIEKAIVSMANNGKNAVVLCFPS